MHGIGCIYVFVILLCVDLQKMTGMMMYDGRLALMPSIDDPSGSPFLTPRPKIQVGHAHYAFSGT